MLHGAGLGFLYKNRAANARSFSHGGVGIFFREGALSLTQIKMYDPDNFEVLSAIGMIKGLSRKIVVISCYLPPNYAVGRARAAIDHIGDCITQAKRKYDDPFLMIGGDFNQWKVEDAI